MKAKINFSLIELLVVISILLLLASITAPTLKKALQHASTLHCQKNLKEISIAMDMYLADKIFYPLATFKTTPKYLYGSWDDLLGQGYDGRNFSENDIGEVFCKKSFNLYTCPQQKEVVTYTNGFLRSYALNANQDGYNMGGFSSFWAGQNTPNQISVNEVPAPSTSILLSEFIGRLGDGYIGAGTYGAGELSKSFDNNLNAYHVGQFNFLFSDYHVELLLPQETWDTTKGTWVYGKYWTRDPND